MGKTLVAYFSAKGHTKNMAQMLAKAIDADLFEIEPKIPYTKGDLVWLNPWSRSSKEMKDFSSRPEIAKKCENMDEYDTVFIGFPIWWHIEPSIINTFLDSYDFTGKTAVAFATSGGSPMGKTDEKLKEVCPAANWKTGKLVNGMTQDALKAWAESL